MRLAQKGLNGGRIRCAVNLLAALLGGWTLSGQPVGNSAGNPPPAPVVVTPPAKEKFHLYLLMGQSNMVGRDVRSLAAQTENPRVLAMNTKGQWVVARDPLHPPVGNIAPGAGLGIPFAVEMLKTDENITIGLVPCAVGGTALSRWVKGADLYEAAVKQAKLAAQAGVISGVLWHQGESDTSTENNAKTYETRLVKMFADLRQDLGLPDLPIVVGQLGTFLTVDKYPFVETVRATLKHIPAVVPHAGYADAADLGDKGDQLHFSADAQKVFGVRYAKAMLALAPVIRGDTVIRAQAGDSEIVIKTTTRTAGAIESLQWGGKEFLNNADHGRELQTCWNGNAGEEPIADETFNPTEAGSLDDGSGATSSSRLLEIQAKGNQLETYSQPAFWLSPSETSGGKPARNKTILTNDRLRKRVVIGYKNLPHVIDCQMTVSLAAEDRNTRCVIEALTGYMPPEFDHFQVFDPKTGQLEPVDDGPGEQALPLVFSTADGKYALGVFARVSETPRDASGPSYGRWNMKATFQVVKWNCVFRLQNPAGLAGDFNCHVFLAVGSLDDVRTSLVAWQKM